LIADNPNNKKTNKQSQANDNDLGTLAEDARALMAATADEWEAATEWYRTLSARVRTVGSIASTAALLVSGVKAFRRQSKPRNGREPAWLHSITKGAGVISSVWAMFRPRDCDLDSK
jgi:hypothetical protein